MNVLLITDTKYWASHITCSNIAKNISKKFNCTIQPRKTLSHRKGDAKNYDVVYLHVSCNIKRQNIRNYRKLNPKSKIVAGIRGWIGFHKTKHLIHLYDAVNADNLRLLEAVKKHHKKVYLCHAGVDTKMFKPLKVKRDEQFTVGWSGNIIGVVKNFDLLPKLGHPYKVTGKPGEKYVRYNRMPKFYNSVDVQVQLSSWGPEKPNADAEGCPLPVLEAGSCGKPVLATITSGAAREYLNDWQIIKGYIRGKGLAEIKVKLNELKVDSKLRQKLGARNRKLALKEWCWSKKVRQYEKFFEGV